MQAEIAAPAFEVHSPPARKMRRRRGPTDVSPYQRMVMQRYGEPE